MSRIIPSFLLFLLFAACEQPAALTEEDRIKVNADVRQMLNQYDDDIRKNGLSAEFKYLDNSPDFFWVPPGYTSALSYDSVVTIIKENAAIYPQVDNTWDTLAIYPLTNRLASFTGKVNSNITDIDGNKMHFTLIETGMTIKREDGWKILHGQTAVLEQKNVF